MYVVVARFVAQEGAGDEVAALLAEMTPSSLTEPGCIKYIINRSVENRDSFLLYEQYTGADAFKAHGDNPEFKRIILGQVVPLLAQRGREIYELVAE